MLTLSARMVAGYLDSVAFVASSLWLTLTLHRGLYAPKMLIFTLIAVCAVAFLPFLLCRGPMALLAIRARMAFVGIAAAAALAVGMAFGLPELGPDPDGVSLMGMQMQQHFATASVEDIVAAYHSEPRLYERVIGMIDLRRTLYSLGIGGLAGLIYHRIESGSRFSWLYSERSAL